MRPRAPDSSFMRGNEVASSNNTLNTFLGGKQKSWMTGDGSLVRPSPRAAVTQSFTAGVLPSPAPSDEPSPPLQQPRETPPDDVHVDVHLPRQGLPRQEYSYGGTMVDSRITEPLMNAIITSPPPNQFELEHPISEALDMNGQTTILRGHHPQQPVNRRQRAMPPQASLPSLKGHIPIIDFHIEGTGGFQALDPGLERPRFNLLRDACNNQDYFYVALHQLFCLWTTDRNIVLGIEGIGDIRPMAVAFQILGQLIRENDKLSSAHLEWFSKFPSPLLDLIHRSKHYCQALSDVFEFLKKLPAEWGPLTSQCQTRGFPPLADELVNRLGLLSPVLQGIFFTATRRNLGFRDDEYGAQMERLFTQDRDGHRLLAARYNTAYPPSEREVVERNGGLADRYMAIRNAMLQNQAEYRAQQQAPVASAARENLSPPAMLHQPDHNILRSSNLHQISFHQNQMHHAALNSFNVRPQTLPSEPAPLRPPVPFINIGSPFSQQTGFENRNPQLLSPSPVSPVSGGMQWHTPVVRSNHHHPNLQMSTPVAFLGPVASTQFPPGQFMHPHHQQLMAAQQTQMSPQLQQAQMMQNAQMMHNGQMMQNAQMMQTSQNAQMMQHSLLLQARLGQQHIPQQARAARQDSMHTHVPSERSLQSQTSDSVALQQPPSQSSRNGSQSSSGPLTPVSNPTSAQQSFQQVSTTNSMLPGQPIAGHHVAAYPLQVPADRSLIPPVGYLPPNQLPNPDVNALHQAHLRSPHLVVARAATHPPSGEATVRHYQAVKGFVVDPTILSLDRPLSKFQFMVPAPIYNRIALDKVTSMTSPPTREVKQGSLQLRMRCIQLKRGTKRCSPSEWVVADTVWPPSVFLEVNDSVLEVRRKSHHGKDLPLDITPHVIRQGVDQISRIRISIPRVSKSHKEIKYAFAIELVEILGHQQILSMCLRERIPAAQTLQNIKTSLSGSLDDDDDEIAMVVSDLTIDLADPFMAKIFDVPVRGIACLHRECFDLETFLNTRNSKPRRPDQPCMVDVWKCPLCGNDSRPFSLRVDEFLVSVRETLAKDGNLDVKAILVAADGTWKPKPEPLNQKRKTSSAGLSAGFESDSTDEIKHSLKRRQTEEIEIIDLGDE